MGADRSRYPWSHDDVCTLSDLLSDGWTLTAIARRLQRSRWAVQGQARKMGVRVRRGATIATQLQLDPEVHLRLGQIADRRGVSRNTLMRITIVLATRDSIWLDKLLDDDMAERNE